MYNMKNLVLYHIPHSAYSQVARIVLAEKGVSWRDRYVMPGPPLFGNYAPEYMRLNPNGVVPTLVVDGKPICDALKIGRFVDETMEGPLLTPKDPEACKAMERWLDEFNHTSMRDISYGMTRGWSKRFARYTNRGRIRNLRKRLKRFPDLAELYRAKISDIEKLAQAVTNRDHVAACLKELDGRLDRLDQVLSEHPFIAGENYSLADGVWTVLLARLRILSLTPLRDRPALASWYEKMRQRPSFESADVWERVGFSQLAKAALRLAVRR